MVVRLIDTLIFKNHDIECSRLFITQYNIICDNEAFDIAKYKIQCIDCIKEASPIEIYYFDGDINILKLRNITHLNCENKDCLTFSYLKDFTSYSITGSIIKCVSSK